MRTGHNYGVGSLRIRLGTAASWHIQSATVSELIGARIVGTPGCLCQICTSSKVIWPYVKFANIRSLHDPEKCRVLLGLAAISLSTIFNRTLYGTIVPTRRSTVSWVLATAVEVQCRNPRKLQTFLLAGHYRYIYRKSHTFHNSALNTSFRYAPAAATPSILSG